MSSERTRLLSDSSPQSRHRSVHIPSQDEKDDDNTSPSRPPPLIQPRYHSLTPSSPTILTPRIRTTSDASDHSTSHLSSYLLLYSLIMTCICVVLILQRMSGEQVDQDGDGEEQHGRLFTRKNHPSFLVLTDIHIEPWYDSHHRNLLWDVCRPPNDIIQCPNVSWKGGPGGSLFDIDPTAPASAPTTTPPTSSPSTSTSITPSSFPYGRTGCDPPLSLLLSALNNAKMDSDEMGGVSFILLMGDLVAHFVPCQQAVLDTVSRVADAFTSVFGTTPVFPVIGNLDLYPTNYIATPTPTSGTCDTQLSALLAIYQKHGWIMEKEQSRNFCRGGYYSHVIDSPEYIGSGIVPWSCEDSRREDDPAGQWEWLEKELNDAVAHGQKVYLVGHIPPGNKQGMPSFCARYMTRYIRFIHAHANTIITQLYGDYSMDEWRLVWKNGTAVSPIFIHPGLTPRKRCNPAYRIWWYDADNANLIDYAQYFTSLPPNDITPITWSFQYSFRREYRIHDLSLDSMQRLWVTMSVDPRMINTYATQVHVLQSTMDTPTDLLCDMRELEWDANIACRRSGELAPVKYTTITQH